MIHELEQELWVDTPKGRAQVLFIIDRGPHSDIEWVCVIEETGEVWAPKNYEIRVCANWTMGINKPKVSPDLRDQWERANENVPGYQTLKQNTNLFCNSCARTIMAPENVLPEDFKCAKAICPVVQHSHCDHCGVPYGAHHYGTCPDQRWVFDMGVKVS